MFDRNTFCTGHARFVSFRSALDASGSQCTAFIDPAWQRAQAQWDSECKFLSLGALILSTLHSNTAFLQTLTFFFRELSSSTRDVRLPPLFWDMAARNV